MINQFRILETVDTTYLDSILLDNKGILQPVSMELLSSIPMTHLQIWGVRNAIYQFVTTEMIEWVKNEIGCLQTIEICAGSGCIGRALGIQSIDKMLQATDEYRFYYSLIGQPTISYPSDIIKMDADQAVDFYKPDCVIGAFVTQYGTIAERNCNPDGPHETQIVKKVKKYIHFGNKKTHAGKHIFKRPHTELSFPWLFTRCELPEMNRVWIWDK